MINEFSYKIQIPKSALRAACFLLLCIDIGPVGDMQRRVFPSVYDYVDELFLRSTNFCFRRTQRSLLSTVSAVGDPDDPLYADVPRPRRDKSERKPYLTPMKELIKRAKEEREARRAQPCRMLENPPENGLLVPELVDVAHQVHRARNSLLSRLARLVRVVPVQRCRLCSEVHIGHTGHVIRTCSGPKSGLRAATHVWRRGGVRDVVFFPTCFHLFDRVGRARVVHNDRFAVPRIPAVLELCIQSGVDLEEFPAKRRTKPVYSIEGRVVDFEDVEASDAIVNPEPAEGAISEEKKSRSLASEESCFADADYGRKENLTELSIMTMDSWFEMVSGTKRIMEKYKVWTCGYCPEVQVGPKGHKVRSCKATKHQMRDGMHAWQEAAVDDVIGPNYVWHVRDPSQSALDNNLKRYYGKAPAVIELCVQAGAPVPDQYRSMMRLDVVPPDRDEVDLVA